jgi:hypothetical protein
LEDGLAGKLKVDIGDRMEISVLGDSEKSLKVVGLINTGTQSDDITKLFLIESAIPGAGGILAWMVLGYVSIVGNFLL